MDWAVPVRCSSEAYFVILCFLPSCKDDASSLWSMTGWVAPSWASHSPTPSFSQDLHLLSPVWLPTWNEAKIPGCLIGETCLQPLQERPGGGLALVSGSWGQR